MQTSSVLMPTGGTLPPEGKCKLNAAHPPTRLTMHVQYFRTASGQMSFDAGLYSLALLSRFFHFSTTQIQIKLVWEVAEQLLVVRELSFVDSAASIAQRCRAAIGRLGQTAEGTLVTREMPEAMEIRRSACRANGHMVFSLREPETTGPSLYGEELGATFTNISSSQRWIVKTNGWPSENLICFLATQTKYLCPVKNQLTKGRDPPLVGLWHAPTKQGTDMHVTIRNGVHDEILGKGDQVFSSGLQASDIRQKVTIECSISVGNLA
ncbi:unnamed protein product [Calicophoron daubneyi]|uniref:Uncharacterized protein n=1 Tax=Calicophoron daubneyi TaxID=300641 RepID=A0AAV2TXY7_CALDB